MRNHWFYRKQREEGAAMAPKEYRVSLGAYRQADGTLYAEIENGNPFKLNDITLHIRDNGVETTESIGSIAANSVWKTGQVAPRYDAFRAVGYYQGAEHTIDESLFDERRGVAR